MSFKSKEDTKTNARSRDGSGATQIPKALFSTGLDTLATKWYKNSQTPAELLPDVRRQEVIETLRIAEALVISPKTSFRVRGENVVLCSLINTFGIEHVERLLEEDALEFILWRGDVLKWVESRPGLHPLAPFVANDPAHSDPQASVELGLKGWSRQPWPKVERLAKLAAERTVLLNESLPQQATRAVYAAYDSGALAADGFDPSVPLDSITSKQSDALAHLGINVLEGMALLENHYDLHESSECWNALQKVCSKVVTSSGGIVSATEEILILEGLPSVPHLILGGTLQWADIIEIRSQPATKDFRRWLWSRPDPRDALAVATEYASIITKKPMPDRTWFKTARVTFMNLAQTVAGAGIGAVAAGVPGVIAGGAFGLGMSLLDAFSLENLLRSANPRRFAEEVIRPRLAQKRIEQGQGNRKQRRAATAEQRKHRK